MTARRYQSDRRAPRPREIRHRLLRAFDDSGADQLDEWMTACPGADTPQPSHEAFFFSFGTRAPLLRASDRPIAIACLRLVTFLPERPLRNVPALRFFMARLTFLAAPSEYFRLFAFFATSCLLKKAPGRYSPRPGPSATPAARRSSRSLRDCVQGRPNSSRCRCRIWARRAAGFR